MRSLLLGATGQLGFELRGPLSVLGEVVAPTRAEVDVDDAASVRACIDARSPDVIVNCTAFNAVDDAEKEPERALRTNRDAVLLLGETCRARGIALVTYSTDYVFDGANDGAYHESDEARPLSAYGRSKLEGERALAAIDAPALVFRTAWVYSLRGRGFLPTMLRLARERETLRIVRDQTGCATFARDLAAATAAILAQMRRDPHGGAREHRGVFHLAGAEPASRLELAEAAFAADPRKGEHRVRTVEGVASSEFPSIAKRPSRVVLACRKAKEHFGVEVPGFRHAIPRMFG